MDARIFENKFGVVVRKFGFESTIISVIYPLLERIGVLWLTGNISAAHEHFLTSFIKRKLYAAIDLEYSSAISKKEKFILYLPEHDMHDMGLLFYYYFLRKRGYEVFFLGQCVPLESLIKVITETGSDYVISAWVAPVAKKKMLKHLHLLKENQPDTKVILIGGQPAKIKSIEDYKIIRNDNELKDFVNSI